MSVNMMDFVCVQKRRLDKESTGHPNHKKVCQGLESAPKENCGLFQPLNECFMDYWDMHFSTNPEASAHEGFLENEMETQSSVIFQNHESKVSVPSCPRCIAGESGHINHILRL
ncbi:uncharacterized protein C10orf143 homolog [Ambystoma mexicanum]|uniref:uncharacterized protein C10orf143 homolog n=1 Tax=Ambystoma mexicanum TaxID=8296 RepID=UPI0037E82C74